MVAGTDERLAAGDVVNVAARLEQAAAPGEVIIGPQTWRLVREAVTAEPLEPLPLKGERPAGGSLRFTSGLGPAPLGSVL